MESLSLRTRLRNLKDDLEANDTVRRIQSHLPPLNFITVHYAYFIATCMIASLIFWGSSDPDRSISYTDSLFLVVSAMTEAGLNTVNLSQMTTFQQIILFFLILIGSSIFVSIGTVLARKHAFERRFKDVVKLHREQRKGYRRSMSMSVIRNTPALRRLGSAFGPGDAVDAGGLDSEPTALGPRDGTSPPRENGSAKAAVSGPTEGATNDSSTETAGNTTGADAVGDGDGNEAVASPEADRISFMPASPTSEHRRVLTFVGVGAHPQSTSFRTPHTGGIYQRGRKSTRVDEDKEEEPPEGWYPHYLTPHTIGRNAQFFGLSRAERDHLGGVEYRAIQLLSWIVPLYFVMWQLLGCLGLGAYMAHNKASTARENGIDPWWVI